MNVEIMQRMDDRRKPCTLCADLTWGEGMCGQCKATLYVGKVVKTAAASYRQRDGVLQVRTAGTTRFVTA